MSNTYRESLEEEIEQLRVENEKLKIQFDNFEFLTKENERLKADLVEAYKYRYTADEVAAWLFFYRGRFRKIPMNKWVWRYREVGLEQMEREEKDEVNREE